MTMPNQTATCAVCGKDFGRSDLRAVADLTPGIRMALADEMPGLDPDALICGPDIARFRRRHLERVLEAERGSLSALDHAVLDSLQAGAQVSVVAGAIWGKKRSLGEVAADAAARFGGSWTFIMSFGVVLVVWMAVNVTGFLVGRFDPYPFILLNLVLSCIAAMQAPIIMMSQRRKEAKDRLRADSDYKVNLKAELEIRHLHDKIDLHLTRQWERLATIQRLQVELLEETTREQPHR
ncbi:MAG: DUF1003 domain-containing protein [Pseudorhodobacter sp.]|nr:DUF1003 domain-containing protein [Pseudorhodobacter sp.]